jgi:hypothetical protein
MNSSKSINVDRSPAGKKDAARRMPQGGCRKEDAASRMPLDHWMGDRPVACCCRDDDDMVAGVAIGMKHE